MTLKEMEAWLSQLIGDSNLEVSFRDQINGAILALATDFKLPALQQLDPFDLTVTTGAWVFAAPTAVNYHKDLWKARDSAGTPIHILDRWEDLDRQDDDHDEIRDHVTHIAALDKGLSASFAVYPKAAETIKLWGYRLPTPLAEPGDVPDCVPAAFHHRVILPKVVVQNFRILQSFIKDPPQQSLKYWEDLYDQGLLGSPRGDLGLLHYLAPKPRRGGGRHRVDWLP